MATSKELFSQWLWTETEKFRKSMPKGATHYKIGKSKVKWYRIGGFSDGIYCGFFIKYSKKKKCFHKAVPVAWNSLTPINW